MRNGDPRFIHVEHYIGDAMRSLESARKRPLDHSDIAIVRGALECLSIVQRSLPGPLAADDKRVAARLRQIASSVKSCSAPSVIRAYPDVEAAASIFQEVADGVDGY